MTTRVALKVDVCNHRALHEGVPRLLEILARGRVRASFFVTFGPDHSGRALRRILRPGFLKKMVRTRAPRMYGVRTLLYGTLLPAPLVGEGASRLLRDVERAGHEVGLHGFDHVGWHDGLARMDEVSIRRAYRRAAAGFEDALGHPPRFSGAPGWQASPASLRIQDELGLAWASDCRADGPFYPELDGTPLRTLQVPTSLPTSDELLGAGRVGVAGLCGWVREHLEPERVNVLGLHAEAEGLRFSGWLTDWLADPCAGPVEFLTLSEVAERERSRAAAAQVVQHEIPGRVGPVACRAPERVAAAGG